jgi:hypothetical protein
MEKQEKAPEGLGGFLILPGLILFATALQGLLSVFFDYLPLFRKGYWRLLTIPASAAYHHLWAPIILSEVAINSFFVLFCLLLIVLYFKKHRWFPRLFVIMLLLNLLCVIGEYKLVNMLPAASEGAAGSTAGIWRAVILAVIAIPYFMRSRRVKNTFVKKEGCF